MSYVENLTHASPFGTVTSDYLRTSALSAVCSSAFSFYRHRDRAGVAVAAGMMVTRSIWLRRIFWMLAKTATAPKPAMTTTISHRPLCGAPELSTFFSGSVEDSTSATSPAVLSSARIVTHSIVRAAIASMTR